MHAEDRTRMSARLWIVPGPASGLRRFRDGVKITAFDVLSDVLARRRGVDTTAIQSRTFNNASAKGACRYQQISLLGSSTLGILSAQVLLLMSR